jgi:hypothetical protein
MSLEFRRNGRKVSLDDFMEGIQQDVIDLGASQIEERVWKARCPVHGSGPTGVRRGGTAAEPTWDVDGCCPKLKEAIKLAF